MLVIFGGLEFCNPQLVESVCAHRVSKKPPFRGEARGRYDPAHNFAA